jgi:hypothetical protein
LALFKDWMMAEFALNNSGMEAFRSHQIMKSQQYFNLIQSFLILKIKYQLFYAQ